MLKACLQEYSLDIPDFRYLCSIPISTCACRGEGIGSSLKARADRFGVKIKNHHDALDDAITCAKLVIACIKECNYKSFQDFYTYNDLPIKSFKELQAQTEFKKSSKFNSINISEIASTCEVIDTSHEFYGKYVVFTGELKNLNRKDAMQHVVNCGGIVKNGITSKTDYLVVGVQDITLVGEGGMSTKEEKAYQMREKGHQIRVINEREFMAIIK